ncbi:hypothetical protein REPUB_Repub18cG0157100 [Reevesia pubescens]
MAFLRTLVWFLALAFMLFSVDCGAKNILVGGSENAWKIPDNSSDFLNQWAGKIRFRVDNFLIWKYDGKVDSVLQATNENYESCNTSKPMKEYKDGNNTKVEPDKSGPFYFISEADGHCQKGQKVHVPATTSPAPAPVNTNASQAQLAKKDGCFLALASLLGVAFAFAFTFV